MLFNTVDFAIFFPLVLLLYWSMAGRSLKVQNLFLIAVSYLFYAFWDWRFLSLIFISSLVDYFVGIKLAAATNRNSRKALLILSLSVNLGMLFTFKYFNFFVQTFVDTFALLGSEFRYSSWRIILPVGISFYTFQTLSYTIDIYRRRIQPTNDPVAFFAFVSFFPQLVAGPIERAANLLSQFEQRRIFDRNSKVDGLRLILGGLFKKMVIADNCALLVNNIFGGYQDLNGSTLFFGAFFFAFQIYGDFSGYSDIAIGSARLLGFDLMKNFNFPYLARNLADFWRRWHISLSTWFRDYLYIPLGGSRGTKARVVFNIFVVFLVSGLWHGANLTFVFWGFIHALFVWPVIVYSRKKIEESSGLWPTLGDVAGIAGTFAVVTVAWVFFRAENLTHAFDYIQRMFTVDLISMPQIPRSGAVLLLGYMALEWIQRNRDHILDIAHVKSRTLRYAVYYMVLFCVFYFAGDTEPFIYFQF